MVSEHHDVALSLISQCHNVTYVTMSHIQARLQQVKNQERKQEDAMLQRKEQLESMRSELSF